MADTNFSGGWPWIATNTISGALPSASDQALYQSWRYGNSTGGETLTYTFPVPSGPYQVTLKFSENSFSSNNQRLFNVAINGNTVLSNFDIHNTAGGEYRALDEVYSNITPDTNGNIVIQMTQGSQNNPQVNAIQIIPFLSPTPTFTPTDTSTPCMINGTPCTSTPTFSPTITPTPTLPLPNGKPILFPNPVKRVSAVNLQVPLATTSNVRVQVFSIAFRKVLDYTYMQVQPGTNLSIPMADAWDKKLGNGLYYVSVEIGGKRWILKMIVLL